jgi:hypothetical protein
MKKMCVIFFLISFCAGAAKKPQASLLDYGNANEPDKDKDFKISSTELRRWCPSFVRVHYTNPFLTQKFPAAVRAFKSADEDKDEILSAKEYKDFTKRMRLVFDDIYEKFVEDYDSSRNKRVDRNELIKARTDNKDYWAFAVPASDNVNDPEDEGENPIVKKDESPKKGYYDIYDN